LVFTASLLDVQHKKEIV